MLINKTLIMSDVENAGVRSEENIATQSVGIRDPSMAEQISYAKLSIVLVEKERRAELYRQKLSDADKHQIDQLNKLYNEGKFQYPRELFEDAEENNKVVQIDQIDGNDELDATASSVTTHLAILPDGSLLKRVYSLGGPNDNDVDFYFMDQEKESAKLETINMLKKFIDGNPDSGQARAMLDKLV